MGKTNISFTIDKMAILSNIIDGEIKARMGSKNDPQKRKEYKELGIINSAPDVSKFMYYHPQIFSNKKFVNSKGSNIFEGILTVSSKNGKESYERDAFRIIEQTYDLSEEEQKDMHKFLNDFWDLSTKKSITPIFYATKRYKDSIEDIWDCHSDTVMNFVEESLGYKPEVKGSVCTYIMYPNYNIHRTTQVSAKQTNLYFGNRKVKDPNRIVANLAHQAIHQPMLPYTTSMTKEEKEIFHGIIKFLADKNVYRKLTGKSWLEMITRKENPEIMAKIYPFIVGYICRNEEDPSKEISKIFKMDKKYLGSLPLNSKVRKLYEDYNIEQYDPDLIADFFKDKKGITPYKLAEIIQIEDREQFAKDRYKKKEDSIR